MAKKKTKVEMKVLMKMEYLGCPIYVRSLENRIFIWDTIFNGEMYSGHIVIEDGKNGEKIEQGGIDEIVKMCYAGAAASVDMLKGVKLKDTDKEVLKRFKEAKIAIKASKK